MSNPMYLTFVLVPPVHAPTIEAAEAALRPLCAPGEATLALREGAIRPWLAFSRGGYEQRVALHDGPAAARESRELAERAAADRSDRTLIASCPARFEVWAPEVDDARSHRADHARLVEALERRYPGAIPFEPGGSLLRGERGEGAFLRPPARTKLAAAREAVAGVELISEKKPVKRKAPPRPKAAPKAQAGDDEPPAAPLARGEPLARGTPLARGKPLARSGGLTRKTPLARGSKPLTRKTPLERGKPLERGAPLDRGKPFDRGAPLDRGKPAAKTPKKKR